MSTSDFNILPMPQLVSSQRELKLPAGSPDPRSEGDRKTNSDSPSSNGKSPKLRLVKSDGSINGQKGEKSQKPSQDDAQTVIFDSLLSQMEKKALDQGTNSMVPLVGKGQESPQSASGSISAVENSVDLDGVAAQATGGLQKKSNVYDFLVRSSAGGSDGVEAEPKIANGQNTRPDVFASLREGSIRTNPIGFSKDGAEEALEKLLSVVGLGQQAQSLSETAASTLSSPSSKTSPPKDPRQNENRSVTLDVPTPNHAVNSFGFDRIAHLSGSSDSASQKVSEARPIVDQIADALSADADAQGYSVARLDRPAKLTVQLRPEGLGQVTLKLETQDGVLRVGLAAEHQSTVDHLKSGSTDLVAALEKLAPGFDPRDLTIVAADPGANDSGRQQPNQNGTNAGISYNEQGRHQANQDQKGRGFENATFEIPKQNQPVISGPVEPLGRSRGSIFV